MKIELNKFGTTLTSRDGGREALAAFQSTLRNIKESEAVEVDFSGVNTFSPSWGDEFFGPLIKMFNQRLILVNTDNLSVKATLDLLESIYKFKFIKK